MLASFLVCPVRTILVILWTEFADSLCGAPHLAVVHGCKFLLKTGTVVGLRVGIDADLCFVTALHTCIELLHDGLNGIMETREPVKCATLGGGGTIGIHPVHTLLSEERHEALCELFYCLVESLGGGVAILAEHFILSQEQALNSTHQ